MVTTRRMEKKKSKEGVQKKNGIREFTIKLNRLTMENSTAFKDASFKFFGIRDLSVVVDSREAFKPCISKLKLVTTSSNQNTVRSLVPWLPTTATVNHTSSEERPKPTTHQFHSELLQKINSPNRSLRKVSNQQSATTSSPREDQKPQWKKIFDEFQEKKATMGKERK